MRRQLMNEHHVKITDIIYLQLNNEDLQDSVLYFILEYVACMTHISSSYEQIMEGGFLYFVGKHCASVFAAMCFLSFYLL